MISPKCRFSTGKVQKFSREKEFDHNFNTVKHEKAVQERNLALLMSGSRGIVVVGIWFVWRSSGRFFFLLACAQTVIEQQSSGADG